MEDEAVVVGIIMGMILGIFILLLVMLALTKDLDDTQIQAISRGYATLNIDRKFQWVEDCNNKKRPENLASGPSNNKRN
jgi:hypothetical protein